MAHASNFYLRDVSLFSWSASFLNLAVCMKIPWNMFISFHLPLFWMYTLSIDFMVLTKNHCLGSRVTNRKNCFRDVTGIKPYSMILHILILIPFKISFTLKFSNMPCIFLINGFYHNKSFVYRNKFEIYLCN